MLPRLCSDKDVGANMEYNKRIEAELIIDWHVLQAEKVPSLKAAALKAYYLKMRNYHRTRNQRSFCEL